MSALKDRIAAIDAFGRALANRINERVIAEELVGVSAATIRRVEELIEETQTGGFEVDVATEIEGERLDPRAFEFHIIRGGISSKPLVVVQRYLGRVGP